MPSRQRFEIEQPGTAASQAPRRRRTRNVARSENRRDEILSAAVASLNRHGLRAMTLGKVAEALALAPTAVGYYFRRKEDLAAACYLQSLARLNRLVDEAAGIESGSPQAVVRVLFEFRRRIELGEESEIAWFEDVRTIHHPVVNAAYTEFFRRLRALLGPAESHDARLARNARTHMLLQQFYWAVSWLPYYHPHDYDRMAERFIDILEHGLVSLGQDWPAKALTFAANQDGPEPRKLFLRAATELINELGYLGASVQKISERLNVTKGAFYHHHEAKNDLVADCFGRTTRVISEAQGAADVETKGAYANLASVAQLLVERQLSGETPLLRAAALAAVPAEMRPELLADMRRTSSRLASVLCDGLTDGSIRPHETFIGAQMLSGAINSATELHFWAPGLPPRKATEIYIRPLFEGLLKPQR